MNTGQIGSAAPCTLCGGHRDANIHLEQNRDHFGAHAYTDARVTVTLTKIVAPDPDGMHDKLRDETPERIATHDRHEWEYVGVMARARIEVMRPGWTSAYDITTIGVWSYESDDCAGIQECYLEEAQTLKSDIEAMASGPITWENVSK